MLRSDVWAMSLLGLLIAFLPVALSSAIFPDCGAQPLQGSPVCDTSLPYTQRAAVRTPSPPRPPTPPTHSSSHLTPRPHRPPSSPPSHPVPPA